MFHFIEVYAAYIIVGTALLLILSIITQLIIWSRLKRLNQNYRRLTRGIDNKNLEDLVLVFTERVEELEKGLLKVQEDQLNIQKEMQSCVKTPVIQRFNAFDNMGSNLSFSIGLLDRKNDGLVLTGIYSRDDSRFYAKGIKDGSSEQLLTPEEQEIVNSFNDEK